MGVIRYYNRIILESSIQVFLHFKQTFVIKIKDSKFVKHYFSKKSRIEQIVSKSMPKI